jgi:hypothetical protein
MIRQEADMSQQQERWYVISWASPFVALLLLVLLLTSSIGQTQDQVPALTDARAKSFLGGTRSRATQQMICNVSAFYSIDANEQVSDVIRIEGRGLATCKNDQGFATDVPVSTSMTARAVGNWANAGELSFSANSSSFVVPRELAQMQDSYSIKPYASDLNDKFTPTVLFGGEQHGLIIEMKFSSATQAFQRISIQSMTIHFDESAPTLD